MYTLQSRYITVEGAIGTGKTSLALLLSSKYNGRAILEVVEKNPFLPHFYDDIKNYAFLTKIFFLLSHYGQQVKTIRQDLFQQLSFADYMFAKDRIFAHLTPSGSELAMYEHFYKIVFRDIPVPNLTVYLKASTGLLMKRIMSRGRSFERNISVRYIDRLNGYYEDYFSDQSNFLQTKLVTVNTDGLDFVGNLHNLEFICQKILEKDRE